jgi:4-hydroxy-tetrahydrodipicolinate synthase
MQGIHTALATPFQEDGQIDFDAFRRLVERQVAGGVHGLVPCGTTGETPTLLAEECRDLLVMTREVAGPDVPVTVGIGTNATRTSVANAERALANGADAGLLVFPYYNKPNPDGLRQHVAAVAATGLPLVLYHVPGRTAHRLDPKLLAELSSHDGVVGLKEATGDLIFGGSVIARTQTPVLSGDDFTFLAMLSLGGAGCVSVVSNVDPAGTVAVYDHYRAGRVTEARDALHRLLPLIETLFVEVNPVPLKAILAELGFGSARPRLPLAPYSGPAFGRLLDGLGLR